MKHELQPEGNYYDKYNTKNIIEKWLMKNFFKKCGSMLENVSLEKGTILEAGCGEGEFTYFLCRKFGKGDAAIEAFDISSRCIQKAKEKCPGVNFKTESIYDLSKEYKYDLVVASEVLEHMDEPAQALDSLLSAAGKYLLITVPNEPLWRMLNMARGKYWSRLGNTPGHVQHWNKCTIRKFILERIGGDKAEIYKIAAACPWLIILVRMNRTD